MDQLMQEIEANFDRFSINWKDQMLAVKAELDIYRGKYLESYKRLVSLQAWRDHLEVHISEDSLAFFLEAQNDALVSHVLARLGSWRSALKSLRSCIENVMFCLYYMDHPVELKLWQVGAHRLAFTDLVKYFEQHPQVTSVNASVTGLSILKAEYSTLSRAVHGSAVHFRMTVDAQATLLWSDKEANLGAWATREHKTVFGLNLLLLTLFREQLHDTSAPNLRKVVSLNIPASRHAQIKTDMGIALLR